MDKILSIKNLYVNADNTKILRGLNLEIPAGQVHAIMGPNGSGKSTLALTLAGHPAYKVIDGSITFNDKVFSKLSPAERATAGLFLSFQAPPEIEGVSLREFLYQAYKAKFDALKKPVDLLSFEKKLAEKIKLLNIPPDFVEKSVNHKLSGGEKKQSEMLQVAMLEPKLIILDEIDSGLDIDALKTICNGLNTIIKQNPDTTVLIITHYPRILHHIAPNAVHIMHNGKIVKSGAGELANEIEKEGYGAFL